MAETTTTQTEKASTQECAWIGECRRLGTCYLNLLFDAEEDGDDGRGVPVNKNNLRRNFRTQAASGGCKDFNR